MSPSQNNRPASWAAEADGRSRERRLTGVGLRAGGPLAAALIVLWLTISATVAAADFTGLVVGIADGDTITVLHEGRQERVRLNGIDAPEKRQAFGQKAKRFTADLAFGQTVTVREFGRDKYGRVIGDVVLPDGRVLNEELVRAGLAWWYCRYSHDARLAELEREAREARRGLWVEPNPMAPWDFRHPDRPPAAPCAARTF